MIRSQIISTGSYLPDQVVTNHDLEQLAPTSDQWVVENIGIKQRHKARLHETTSDFAALAGFRAIANAHLAANDIDLIIVATATPDRPAPSTASIVQAKLGAWNAAAFDIAAVCSGFIFGLSVADQYILSGTYKNILLIGADAFSRITDYTKRDCVFFGDGAGAVVIQRLANVTGIQSIRIYTDGRGRDGFTVPAGGSEMPASFDTVRKGLHYFKMNTKAVYEAATKYMKKAIADVLLDCNLTIDDIDVMVPHQPSIRLLRNVAKEIGIPEHKVAMNMDHCGNTSAGTIPILLDELNKQNRIAPGATVLMAAVGSGWAYGAAILEWQ